MRDELSRIESVYGSVAEYNRVREEEESEAYWNSLSEEEQRKEEEEFARKQQEYHEEIDALTIEPSPLAKQLRAAYDKASVQYKDDYYASQDFYQQYLRDSMSQIAAQYGKKFEDEAWQFGHSDPGKFSISYEYGRGQIFHAVVDNLNKEDFMQMYADMGQIARYNVFPTYRDTKEHTPDRWGHVDDKHYISNSSIGELRRNEFDRWGVPNDDAHKILKKVRQAREEKAADLVSNIEVEQNDFQTSI